MNNTIYVALGMVILCGVSYGLVLLYSFLYMKYIAKNKDVKFSQMSLSAAVVSLAWVISTFITLAFASNASIAIFAASSLILFFGVTYYFSGKLFKVDSKHKVIYSLFLALILNPFWLTLTKII